MTSGERIKKVRKALDLTQQEFADKIGSKRNTVATYEMGRTAPSAAIISLICREFNVNEEWLRTGKGEMFKKTPDSIAGQLVAEFGLDEFLQSVVSEYLKLNEEQRQTVRDFVSHIASEIPSVPAPLVSPAPALTIEEEARAEAEKYYRRLIEEKKLVSQALSAKKSDAG